MNEQTYVDELSAIELIEELEDAYLLAHGCKTINVSHWDPSPEFRQRLEGALEIPLKWPAIDYLFSYELERSPEILTRLGAAASTGSLVTPSGSISILCVVNWLAAMGVKQLMVLFPAYFSIRHICRRCDVAVREHFMVRRERSYVLPPLDYGERKTPCVLWITNPVFATGVTLADDDIQKLRLLLDSGWYVIADECLALAGTELGRHLSHYPRFVGIYSPHKSIGVNAVKFSIITFHLQYQRFFDHWADVLYGCLGSSTLAAIDHYLSANFTEYSARFLAGVGRARAFVASVCQTLVGVDLDHSSIGNFATCYLPAIPSARGIDRTFLHLAIDSSGGSFIPGNRNGFNDALGFNFRINFAQDSALFRGTLARLISHFSKASVTPAGHCD